MCIQVDTYRHVNAASHTSHDHCWLPLTLWHWCSMAVQFAGLMQWHTSQYAGAMFAEAGADGGACGVSSTPMAPRRGAGRAPACSTATGTAATSRHAFEEVSARQAHHPLSQQRQLHCGGVSPSVTQACCARGLRLGALTHCTVGWAAGWACQLTTGFDSSACLWCCR